LLIAFLFLTIAPLAVNAWLVVSRTSQEMRQATQDRLQAIVTLKTAQIDGWLAHQEQALAQVSAELAARPATTTLLQAAPGTPASEGQAAAAEVRTILEAALARQPGFRSFALARPADEGEPLLEVTTSRPTTATLPTRRVAPIPGPEGLDESRPAGLLVGYLDPDLLVTLVANTPDLGPTGRAYLVAPGGQSLWPASAPSGLIHSPGIDAALSGAHGSAMYQDYQGRPVVGAYGWLPSLGAAIIVEQPQREAFAPADDLAALLLANTLVVALLTTLLAAVIIRRITRPIVVLTTRAVQIADGDFWQTVPVDRRDEIGILARAFNIMTEELRQLYENLEGIVTERTRQLREANRQLQHYTMRLALSAEIGRIATSILDQGALLRQVTDLIRGSYELSYVGVFLLDEPGQCATLYSHASEGLWDRSVPAQTPVGDVTPVGQATADGHPHLLRLAPTHAELAIPLQTRQRVLGVLDLWSNNPDAFSDIDIRAFQSLGDQISVAIENARAYAQEQETTRRLRQLDDLRMQSMGSMSHELTTALNSIIGFSRLILKGVDGPLTDMQRTDVAAIHQSGRHLVGMLDHVLDLVDLERGILTLDRQLLGTNALIEDVLTTMHTLPGGPIVTTSGVVSPHLPAVLGDGKRLRQVLIHLIAEAGQMAEMVTISADAPGSPGDESGQQHVRIRVTGLPNPDLAALPAELAASANGVAWDDKGASLGVALSKRIVELHGGQFWTQPTAGEGWAYVILLPVAPSADGA
jgi:signal transduction histidine kinase